MAPVKYFSFFIFIFIATINLAQLNETIKDAFVKSYHEEQLGMHDKAISSIQAVYSEKSYEANYRLGWLFYLDKKYQQSVFYYKKAILNMPKSTEPLWALGQTYTAMENWTALNSTNLKILKLDSKNSVANYRVGVHYYYNKKYHTARKYFAVVVNLYPTDFDALHMMAWSNYFIGNFEQAKAYFLRALIVQPTNESALNGLKLIK